jgi:hypothetical protein
MTFQTLSENPAGYQVPIADAIAEKLGSDPNFSAQLIMFVTEFQKAARSYQETHNEAGSGAVAAHGSIAAGKGGVAVGGNVKGSITVHNTESRRSSGGTGT